MERKAQATLFWGKKTPHHQVSLLCLVFKLPNRAKRPETPPSLKMRTHNDVPLHRKSHMYIQNFIYGIQCIKHSVSSQSKSSIHLHRGRKKSHRKKTNPAFCIYNAVCRCIPNAFLSLSQKTATTITRSIYPTISELPTALCFFF